MKQKGGFLKFLRSYAKIGEASMWTGLQQPIFVIDFLWNCAISHRIPCSHELHLDFHFRIKTLTFKKKKELRHGASCFTMSIIFRCYAVLHWEKKREKKEIHRHACKSQLQA
jgi:hypothetical protein